MKKIVPLLIIVLFFFGCSRAPIVNLPELTSTAAILTSSPILTPTPEPTPVLSPDPTQTPGFIKEARIEGNGDNTLLVEAGNAICAVSFTHEGNSNFTVKDEDSEELFVNTIGNYVGSHYISKGSHLLTIKADGKWTCEIKELPALVGPETFGSGDSCPGWFFGGIGDLEKPGNYWFLNKGEGNFIVQLISASTGNSELIVNEIGEYEGAHQMNMSEIDMFILDVHSDGGWAVMGLNKD